MANNSVNFQRTFTNEVLKFKFRFCLCNEIFVDLPDFRNELFFSKLLYVFFGTPKNG